MCCVCVCMRACVCACVRVYGVCVMFVHLCEGMNLPMHVRSEVKVRFRCPALSLYTLLIRNRIFHKTIVSLVLG